MVTKENNIREPKITKPIFLQKCCPKCHNNILSIEKDHWGYREFCVCGYSKDINESELKRIGAK